jgi:DegV family protein with EDD domain
VIHAAELADAGIRAAGIAAALMAEQDSWHTVLFAESMEHLRRGGEIGKAAQLVGAAISLRPLLQVEGGLLVPFERTRTRPRAVAALLDFARDLSSIERASVIHNTTPGDAGDLARELETMIGRPVDIVQIGPVISSHVGPGVLGIALKEGPLD